MGKPPWACCARPPLSHLRSPLSLPLLLSGPNLPTRRRTCGRSAFWRSGFKSILLCGPPARAGGGRDFLPRDGWRNHPLSGSRKGVGELRPGAVEEHAGGGEGKERDEARAIRPDGEEVNGIS